MRTQTLLAPTLIPFLILLTAGPALAQDLDVTEDPLPSGTYEAAGTVTAQGVTIPSGNDVTFRGGERIVLAPGTSVERGALFHAETGGVTALTCDLSGLDLPPVAANDRFFPSAIEEARHPLLSLNGFDCTTSPDGCGSGLGLQNIVQPLHDGLAGQSVSDVFLELRNLATDGGYVGYPAPDKDDIQGNTQRLQAYAFAALASYVLEPNT